MDKRIGAQLFTCRDYCQSAEDLDETIRRVREIGYTTVQISAVGRDITGEQIRNSAERWGVEVVCTHRSYDEYTKQLDETIRLHKDMGCSIAGLGMMPGEAHQSKEGLFDFIKKFDEISEKLGKEGITFGYHNHAVEFRKYDGKTILEHLMENTNSNFKLIFDVYWAAHAGINPVKVMEKYADRIAVMHYKDKKVFEGNDSDICEVGEGFLDWDGIISATERLGIKWAMVEQDRNWIDGDPFKSLEVSYKFLTTKGFI